MGRPRNSRPQLTRDSLGRGDATPRFLVNIDPVVVVGDELVAESTGRERPVREAPPPHSFRCWWIGDGSPARGLTSEWSCRRRLLREA
jgi:hypothetical protein